MNVPDETVYRFKSRKDLKKDLQYYEVIFQYKALAECTVDVNNAIAIMDEADIDYTLLRCTTADCHIYFETPYPIGELRKLWYDENLDLHYMIESLDYVDDYTGIRYFEKYENNPKKYENFNSDAEDDDDDE
jgi:hypothetical protein